MALVNHTSPAPFGAIATFKLVNLFETTIKTVSAWNSKRKTVNMLSTLSDDVLSDIGLTHHDFANLPARF